MIRLSAITATGVLVAAVAFAQPPAAPAAPAAAPSLTDVTGVWTMQVESHQIGLELEQQGTKVEGVMLAMGQRILLVGTYEDRTLTLKRERAEDGADAGAGGAHGGGATAGPAGQGSGAGPIVATMKDDGTLDGELSTQRGRAPWTGERLKKR